MHHIAGINSIQQAFDNGIKVIKLYVDLQKDSQRIARLVATATKRGITVERVNKLTLDLMVVGNKHQGVVAESQPQNVTLAQLLKRPKPLILLLDGLQDPHNLGACLRSAAAAHVDAVVIPKNRSASVNATVSKVASGGAELIPIFTETNLSRVLVQCQQAGLWSIALTGCAQETIYQTQFNQGIVIMMGSEDNGLSANLIKQADYQACIPMPGAIESLNVSVATGVVLFEALRQRNTA